MRHRRAPFFGLLIVLAGALPASAQPAAPGPPDPRPGPPSWAADVVWYSVVVDRFRNGDPKNDPRPSDLRGAAPGDPGRDWQVAPWTSSFYTLLPWERASGRDFAQAVLTRRYGGDLAGVLEKLDHLTGLGVNGLLLSPVLEAPSALKRDPASLHHVDNNFGPDPEGDRLVWATENPADPATWKWSSADRLFLRLVQECRRRQIRLVVEMPVASVGPAFWAYRDVRARGAASRYASWFEAPRADEARAPQDDRVEWKREGEGLATGPRDHLRTALRRWSDPNGDGDPSDGVDGFLLSGVARLGQGSTRELRRALLGFNPDALVAGDLGLEDEARTRPVDPTSWLSRGALDVAANHAWGAIARAFFLDRETAASAPALDTMLSRIHGLYRPETLLALPLPLDGPDGERAASRVVNPDREAGVSASPKDNPRYDVRAPRGDEGKRLRLLAAFQFASAGAPLVSYGTETGLFGAAEPDNLRPMLWRELRYEDDAGHPTGAARKADPVRFDEELLKYFQTLGKVRAAQPALRRGTTETLLADESRRVYVFARVLGEERVVAAFNLTEKEQSFEAPFAGEQARDLISGRKLRGRDGKVSVVLLPFSAALVASEAPRAQ